jgi:hypothetical protein
MKYFQETTEWDSPTAPNHIYYLSDDKSKMVGYIQQGTTVLKKFKQPITISTKGRKFKLIAVKGEPDSVYFGTPTPEYKPDNVVATVAGSGGKVYKVSKHGENYSCTCTGFQFRRRCKHTQEFDNKSLS